jgi:hypothetical protein
MQGGIEGEIRRRHSQAYRLDLLLAPHLRYQQISHLERSYLSYHDSPPSPSFIFLKILQPVPRRHTKNGSFGRWAAHPRRSRRSYHEDSHDFIRPSLVSKYHHPRFIATDASSIRGGGHNDIRLVHAPGSGDSEPLDLGHDGNGKYEGEITDNSIM